jgi:hypothetical protein
VVALPVLVLLCGVPVGCAGDGSSDDAQQAPPVLSIDVPDVVDEVCVDPVGDLSLLAIEEGGLSEPAGVDLVRGEVHLDPEQLEVIVVTQAELLSAPAPLVTLFQGPPGMVESWELRAEWVDGSWNGTLITYRTGTDRILVEELRQPIDVAPVVEGTTFRLTLPRRDVPPPLTVAWVFGTTSRTDDPDETTPSTESDGEAVAGPTTVRSTDGVTTFDECDNVFTDRSPDDTAPDDTAPVDTAPVDTAPTAPG